MQVIKDLLGSEKAIVALLLIIGATVLTAKGDMSLEEWQSYTKWIAGFYIAGKTATGVAERIADRGDVFAVETGNLEDEIASNDSEADSSAARLGNN